MNGRQAGIHPEPPSKLIDRDDPLLADLVHRLRIGKQIGVGTYGKIFEVRGRPERVVKIVHVFKSKADKIRANVRNLPECFAQLLQADFVACPKYDNLLAVLTLERLYPLEKRDEDLIQNVNDYLAEEHSLSGESDQLIPELKNALEAGLFDPAERRIARKMLNILMEAHEAGYIYPDFHEGNVMQTFDGRWKLIEPENVRKLARRLHRLARGRP